MFCLVARFGERTLRFRLPNERAAIGSSSTCQIPLPFTGVSRLHAWITPTPSGAHIEDAGSKNRLIVNGDRIDEVELHPGVIVQVGRAFLTLEEASSGEFDLAVRVATPEPDLRPRKTDDTDDSPVRGVSDGPAAGLRLIREVEKAGNVECVVSEVLDILALHCLLVFEIGSMDDGCAITRAFGKLPDESVLVELENRMIVLPDNTPSSLPLPPEISAVVYRSSEGHPDRCVVGIRSTHEVIEPWALDLFEYIARRSMGSVGTDKLRSGSSKRGLDLAEGMITGESAAYKSLLAQLEAVADTRMDVLLIGETGTGKELLARTLHQSGPTSSGPFIAINCAAIPSELLEAELFGVKGRVATGVDPRVGLFLEADGGSIFLDEIGELAEPLQAKLLRVLQEREVLPLGGSQPRKINVRLIAATNRELLVLADQGRFRRDLYYRMSGLFLRVPSLRERKDDIPALALGFLERSAREHQKSIAGISRKAMSLLLEHDWPGNIRELQNEVARAVLFSHDRGVLHIQHFGAVGEAVASHRKQDSGQTSSDVASSITEPSRDHGDQQDKTLQERVDDLERAAILAALDAANGNKSRAARALGVTRNGLAMKMKRLGI